jgi:hypothetical protein
MSLMGNQSTSSYSKAKKEKVRLETDLFGTPIKHKAKPHESP